VHASCPTAHPARRAAHIVAIDRRVAGHRVPFDAVQQQIVTQLSAAATERARMQYVRVLAGRARVDGVDLGSAETPLVQ